MIGVDVVDIERFRRVLERIPGIATRLFTDRELGYCRAKLDPALHLAGTLGAKEAIVKAMGMHSLAACAHNIEIEHDSQGRPGARLNSRSDRLSIFVSIAHDGPVAVGVAITAPTVTPESNQVSPT